MKTLLILLLFFHTGSPVKYKLEENMFLSFGFPNIQHYGLTGTIQDVTVVDYDDTMTAPKVTHDWMKVLIQNEPADWETITHEIIDYGLTFQKETQSFSQLSNQTEVRQIIQMSSNCVWDNKTNEVDAFLKYATNGEDFIQFDLKTESWTALDPRAEAIKTDWDGDKFRNRIIKFLLTVESLKGLKLGLRYGESYLDRKVLPSVSLLQKTPSSPVSCHATGFYPDKGLIYWRKDGEEIHEGVDPGDILPNQDESFQTSVDLNVSSIPPEDWMKYDCVFELTGAQNIIITKLDKDVIRSNHGKTGFFNEDGSLSEVSIIVIAVMAVVILVIIAVLGFMSFKKRRINVMPLRPETPSSDTISL